MTPTIDRLLWRLDVYDRICAACAQGGIAPLRFLTFRPEKMRIRIGESLMRSQIPVIFAPDLGEKLGALLPPAVPTPSSGPLSPDRDTLRRALALAQLDSDLDIVDVATWKGADTFLATFEALGAKFLEEAKESGSGEETAALFQLVAMSSLRNVLLHRSTQAGAATERFLGQAAFLAHLADRALAAAVEKNGAGLSGRLGLLLAASCSPLSLMGAAAGVAARPANIYRTMPQAFQRARDLVRANMDKAPGSAGSGSTLDVTAMRARLSAEILMDPERKRDIVRSMIAEAVRDLAMLSTLTQGSDLRDIATRSSALAEALFQPLGPEKLRARIERHPRGREEPLGRLLILTDSVQAALAGDMSPLERVGSIEERADIAAAGAILLAFDELALEQGGHALGMVRPVPEHEAQKAREAGRAYWFGLDGPGEYEPLFLLPRKREEAFLFADMKDFTKRTQAIREENMADFLKERFYEPILKTCSMIARSPNARVSVVNLLGDAVATRGDIQSMVALALYVRRLLEDAAKELEDAQQALKYKDDEALGEIETELARVKQQLAVLPAHDPQRADLLMHQQGLEAGREERVRKAVGAGLEAGVFVTWGREASIIECGNPEVGEWKVTIAEQLNAAARGTARSAKMISDRAARRMAMEQAVGRKLTDPFFVHTSADPDDVTVTTDFHNAGSALTGEALAAYQAANPDLVFRRMSVPRTSLPPMLHKYFITRPTEEFILVSDARGTPGLMFRWSGRTLFRGLEANGGVDIWEILLVDRGFGLDFVTALRST